MAPPEPETPPKPTDPLITPGIALFALATTAFGIFLREQKPGDLLTWRTMIPLVIIAATAPLGMLLIMFGLARQRSTRRWWWKLLLVGIAVVLAVLAGFRYGRSVTPYGQGVLLGVGAVVFLQAAWHLIRRYYLRWKNHLTVRREEEARHLAEVRETATASTRYQSMLRFGQYFRPCDLASETTYQLMRAICQKDLQKSAERRAVARLMEAHALPPLRKAINDVLDLVQRANASMTAKEFDAAGTAVRIMLAQDLAITEELIAVKEILGDEAWLALGPRADQLITFHFQSLTALNQIRNLPDLWEFVPELHTFRLQELLHQLEGPEPSPAGD